MDLKKHISRFVAYVLDHAGREAWFTLVISKVSSILAETRRNKALDVAKCELFDSKVMTVLGGILKLILRTDSWRIS